MDFRILGPMEVVDGQRLVDLGGRKQRAVLALLLIEANRVVPVADLVDRLWGEEAPPAAMGSLQAYVSNLRRALEPDRTPRAPPRVLVSRPPGYVLLVEDRDVDARRFASLAAEGHALVADGQHEAAQRVLRASLDLWRGDALADFATEPFARREMTRLEELRAVAVEDHLEAEIALGDHAGAVAELEHLVAERPHRERLWSLLMLALYRSGRQGDALSAFQRARARLAEELGVQPGNALRRLEAAILANDPSLDAPALRAPAGERPGPAPRSGHNLPAPVSSFIGRDGAVAELKKHLESCRLVTLTGAGGCGKTRLAVAVAADIAQAFSHGAWLVDLAPLSGPDFVPHAVAAAVGVREQPGSPVAETLVRSLHDCQLLLVLDNCEHLVDAAAGIADTLLRTCPGLRVLATSREPLGVSGELIWRVPPMATPPAGRATPSIEALIDYESVRLFVDRARSARPELSVTDQDAAVIAQLCTALDGMPLAIELAAARVATLSIAEITARLADRFRLLNTGSRTAGRRHRTLRAAVEWSYDLLTSAEQRLLRRLSVFVGGFTLGTAEAVCSGGELPESEVLDLLECLARKSLVVVDMRADGARYGLLETIRHFARERLKEAGEADVVAARHRDFFLAFAQQGEQAAFSGDSAAALDSLEAEHPNLRAALEWSLSRPAGDVAGLRLVHSLYPLWALRGHRQEGRRWMESLAARAPADSALRAAVVRRAGNLAWDLGDQDEAARLWEEALAAARRCDDRPLLGQALLSAGVLACSRGDSRKGDDMLSQSLSIARETGDASFVAQALLYLGWSAQRAGRYREALLRAQEVADPAGSHSPFNVARALELWAHVAREQANYGNARSLLEKCRELLASVGDRTFDSVALEGLGLVAAAQGRVAEARAWLEEALALARELEVNAPVASVLGGLSEVCLAEGDVAGATRLAHEALGNARRSLEVFALSWALNRLGAAGLARADLPAARAAYEESLALSRAASMPWHLATAMEGLAALEATAGRWEAAARLLGEAAALRDDIGAPLAPVERGRLEELVGQVRRRLGSGPAASSGPASPG